MSYISAIHVWTMGKSPVLCSFLKNSVVPTLKKRSSSGMKFRLTSLSVGPHLLNIYESDGLTLIGHKEC